MDGNCLSTAHFSVMAEILLRKYLGYDITRLLVLHIMNTLGNLAEHGLIGLIVFILIFLKIFQNIWQSLETTTDPWGKQLYISYIAGLSGYMIGMFATNTGPSLVYFLDLYCFNL